MGFLDKLFNKDETQYKDTEIITVAAGDLIPPEEINDPVFSASMLGQTVGIVLADGNIASPANGVLESVFPTGHAFTLRMADGTGIIVHIGIDTVELNGKGFKVMAHKDDKVKAGQVIVKVDLDEVRGAGYDLTTMIVIAEPVEGKTYDFVNWGKVEKGQVICEVEG